MKFKTGHSNPTLQTSVLWFRSMCHSIDRAGLDVRPLALEIGLDLRKLDNPEAFLDDEYTALLLIAASNKSHNPDFGLKAGQYFIPSAFGPLGYSMMSCTTLHEALERAVLYTATVSDGTRAKLHCDTSTGFLEITTPNYHPDVAPLVNEYLMLFILTAFRWMLDEELAPLRVEFMHSEPDSFSKHIQAFGVKPVFSSNRNGFLFSQQQLNSRIIFADTAMSKIHDDYAASKLFHHHKPELAPELLRTIQKKLHEGEPDLTIFAKHLNISARTLQRRLQHENTSFHELVDEVRRKLLAIHIADNSMSFKQMSQQLGFASQSSFTRAVKRWNGMTPSKLQQHSSATEHTI